MKNYLVLFMVTILFTLFSGCVSSEENIKPINSESLNILDVEWLGMFGVGCNDGLIFKLKMDYTEQINSNGRIYFYISETFEPIDFEGKDISTYDCTIDETFLQSGVYVYEGFYRGYTHNQNEEGKVYLFVHDEKGKLIKTKIIDTPHYSVKISPPNAVIYSSNITYDSTPYYITLENTGNIPATIRVGQKKYIESAIEEPGIAINNFPSRDVYMSPGEKEEDGLWIKSVNRGDINLGDSGITEISAGYVYQEIYYECDSVRIRWVADEL